MAPQGAIPVASTVLSTIGTIFWCVQLVPQIWYNWRKKDTEGLPAVMMMLWAVSVVPFGVYAIVQRFAVPIQVQPQIFCVLVLISWGQILYYNGKWKLWSVIAAVVGLNVLFGGLEVLLCLTLRGPYANGISWPVEMIGVLAAILLAAGLVPPYWELWKRSGRVVGINFVFLAVDWNGALFSLLAVCTQQTFDALGGTLYIIIIVMEGGIFASHCIWMLRNRKRLKEEAEDGPGLELKDAEAAVENQSKEPNAGDDPGGGVPVSEA